MAAVATTTIGTPRVNNKIAPGSYPLPSSGNHVMTAAETPAPAPNASASGKR